MNRRLYFIPLSSVIVAVFIAILGWFTESSIVRFAAPAYGLALISVGFGLYSFLVSSQTDGRMDKITTTLARIEGLQEEIQKKQEEQSSSSSPLVTSLQALSQYYFDYIAKQKAEDEKETKRG